MRKISKSALMLPVDSSNEVSNYVLPGVQHKYTQTATVFVSLKCKEICPWCFRGPRIFRGDHYSQDRVAQLDKTLEWLKTRKEVSNVLLTGGDALKAENLLEWISAIDTIPHIRVIRVGSRLPVLHPEYLEILKDVKLKNKRLMVVMHIVRADEIKEELKRYTSIGHITFLSQTPLLKTINDSSRELVMLWDRLIQFGIMPYYVFHCRPVKGNKRFIMSLGEGYEIFQKAQDICSGTNKRAKYVMSADIGKLEIMGRQGDEIILKLHQARDEENLGKIITCPADNIWFN